MLKCFVAKATERDFVGAVRSIESLELRILLAGTRKVDQPCIEVRPQTVLGMSAIAPRKKSIDSQAAV